MRGGRRGRGDLGMAWSLLACFLCVLSFVDCQHPRGFEAAKISQNNVDDASTAGLALQEMSTSPSLFWRGSASLPSPGLIVCSFGFVLLGFVLGLTAQQRFLLLGPKSGATDQSWKGERTLQPLARCRGGDGGDGAVSSAGVEGEVCAYEDGGAGNRPPGDARDAGADPGPERGAIVPCLENGAATGVGSDSQGPVGGSDDDVREGCPVAGSSTSQVGIGGASEVCSTRGGRGEGEGDVGRPLCGEKDESTSLALSSEPASHVSRAVVAACSVRCEDEVIEENRAVGGSLSVNGVSRVTNDRDSIILERSRAKILDYVQNYVRSHMVYRRSESDDSPLTQVRLVTHALTHFKEGYKLEVKRVLNEKLDGMAKICQIQADQMQQKIKLKIENMIFDLTKVYDKQLKHEFVSVLFFGIVLMLVSGGIQIWRVGLPKVVAPKCGGCAVVPLSFWRLSKFTNSLWLCASVVSCYLRGLSRVSLSVLVLLTVPLLMGKVGVFNNFEHMVVLKLFVFGASCGGAGRIAVSGLGGSGSLWLCIWALWMALEGVLFSAAHELSRYQARREVEMKSEGVGAGGGGGGWLETRRRSLRSLKLLIWVVVGVVVPVSAGVLPFALHS